MIKIKPCLAGLMLKNQPSKNSKPRADREAEHQFVKNLKPRAKEETNSFETRAEEE